MENKGYKNMIIYTDDDPDDREFFETALGEIAPNRDLQVFKDAEAMLTSLEELSSTPPELIFLDINMPGKNGKECLKDIKNHDVLKNVPVIMMTTSMDERDVKDTYELGASLFVTKPPSYIDLIRVLRHIFGLNFQKLFQKQDLSSFVFQSQMSLSINGHR